MQLVDSGLPDRIFSGKTFSDTISQKNALNIYLKNGKTMSVIIYDTSKGSIYDSSTASVISSDKYFDKNPFFKASIDSYKNGNAAVRNGQDIYILTKDYRNTYISYRISAIDLKRDYTSEIDEKGLCFITDKDMNVLMSSTEKYDERTAKLAFEKTASAKKTSGTIYAGGNMVVFKRYSSFIYINIIDKSLLSRNIKTSAIIIILTLIITLITIIMLCKISAWYKKITSDFLKKIDISEQSQSLHKEKLLGKMLTTHMSSNDISRLCQMLPTAKFFRLLIIHADNIDNEYSKNTYDENNLLLYGINNISSELLGELYKDESIITSKNIIAHILAADSFDEEQLKLCLDSISNNVKKYMNVHLTFVAGELKTDLSMLIKGTATTLSMLQYLFGSDDIIYEANPPQQNVDSKYPAIYENKIVSAITSGNKNEIESAIDEFKEITYKSGCIYAKKWVLTLFINVIKKLNTDFENPDFYIHDLPLLANTDKLSAATEYLKTVFCTISDNCSLSVEKDFTAVARELIQKSYSDCECNISYLADALGISIVYAGHKFKKLFGETFNAYLTKYRIEQAKILLASTDDKIVDISAKCGFNTNTYFLTLFKKHTALTPQQYRNMMSEQ